MRIDSIDGSTHGDDLIAALAVASALHGAQTRKGTRVPYRAHLLAVAALVMEAGGDLDQQVAAVLHDVVEDTDATNADIRRRFGPRVAAIVRACSDTEAHPKPPWFDRKSRYIRHLARARADALVVSLADKVHNGRSIVDDYRREGPRVWRRFNEDARGAAGQLWYFRSLARVFTERRSELTPAARRLATELARVVANFEVEVAEREPDALVETDRFAARARRATTRP